MENRKRFIIIVLILFIFLGLTIFTFANPKVEETGDGESDTEQKVDNDKQDNQDSDEKEDENNNENNTTDEVVDRVDDVVQNNQNHTTLDDSYDKALKAVEEAEKLVESNSYNTAKDLVDKVTDDAKKQELQNRLDEVKEGIDVKALVETLKSKTESAGNLADMNDARKFKTDEEITSKVSDLSNEDLKDELNSVLDELNKLLDDEVAPKLNVEDGEIYNTFVKVEATDEEGNGAKVTIKDSNGNVVESITEDGTYTITAEDDAFNSVSVTIVVDSTSPKFNNLTSGVIARSVDLGVTDANFDYILLEQLDKEGNVIRTIKESRDWTSFGGKDFEGTWRATAYDKAGNKSDTYTFVIDATLPTSDFARMSVLGGNGNEESVNVGKTVWVYVRYNEKLASEPKITIAGVEAKVFLNDSNEDETRGVYYTYVGEVVLPDTLKNGEKITFNVTNAYDLAGNKAEDVTEVTEGNVLVVDREGAQIKVNGTTDIKELYNSVNLYVTDEHSFTGVITNKTTGKTSELNSTSKDGNGNYVASTGISSMGDGEYEVVITDEAGNESKVSFKYDATIPTSNFARMSVLGGNGNEESVNVGKTVWVYVRYNEKLASEPKITIAGVEAKVFLNDSNEDETRGVYYTYVGEVVLPDTLKNGEKITFNVTNAYDLAGNKAEDVTEVTEGNVLVVDREGAQIKVNGTTDIKELYNSVNLYVTDEHSFTGVITNKTTGKTSELNSTSKDGNGNYVASTGISSMGDGEYEVVITDEAGNESKVSFKYDATIPYSTYVEIKNLNQITPGYAKVGDTIWVYVIINEHLSQEPTITINGVEAKIVQTEDGNKFNADWYKYVGEVVMTEDMDEGEIEFTISGYKDLAGNEGEVITNEDITADLKEIILDKTNPTYEFVEIMNIGRDGRKTPVTPGYAVVGDRVWVNVNVSEHIPTAPTITINGVEANIVQIEDGNNFNADWYRYVGEVVMTDDMKEGEISFTVDFKDAAGNSIETVTKPSRGLEKIVLEKSLPTVTLARVQRHTVNGVKSNWAKVGNELMIVLHASEPLYEGQEIQLEIGGQKVKNAKLQYSANNQYVAYNVPITQNMNLKNGEKIEVKVSGLIDVAGNESEVYYTTGDSDEFSTYFYNTNPTVSLTGLNDGNAHYSVQYEKSFNLVIKNSKGEIKRKNDSVYSEDSLKYYSSGKIGYLGEGTFTYEITDFAGNKTVDKFEIKNVAMSIDGIVLEEFPYLSQSYSVTKTDTIIPDKKITVTSENDEEYKSFIAKGYKPVDVIWWAQFSCDETMCEGFNQHNSDVKSNLIVEGRRGDVSITMEAPDAKEGYEFVGWEASIIDYYNMKIQGFEAIYKSLEDINYALDIASRSC